jgi:hypothetical protein
MKSQLCDIEIILSELLRIAAWRARFSVPSNFIAMKWPAKTGFCGKAVGPPISGRWLLYAAEGVPLPVWSAPSDPNPFECRRGTVPAAERVAPGILGSVRPAPGGVLPKARFPAEPNEGDTHSDKGMKAGRCARRSWRGPAGESPVREGGSARLVTSVASWKVTTTAKRTQ